MEKSKIESILGFALRAGKIVFGADNVCEHRKRLYVVIMDENLSERSKERVTRIAAEKKTPVILSKKKSLEDITNKTNCKVVAVADKQMGLAILNYTDENFEHIVVEVK